MARRHRGGPAGGEELVGDGTRKAALGVRSSPETGGGGGAGGEELLCWAREVR
jgi:hypothetical protein